MMIRTTLCFAFCVLVAATWARVPRNAFIAHPAETRSALVGQVEKNPAVRDRYQRHFGMTRSELTEYFSELSPGSLRSDGVYEVFNVPKTGVLRSRLLTLKRGTRVWKDSLGQPILMMICGNPLTRGPKSTSTANPVALVTRMEERQTLAPYEGQETPEVAADLEPIVLMTSSEPIPPDVANESNPVVVNVPTVSTGPIAPTITPVAPAVGAIAGAIPWFIAPGFAGFAIGLPFVVPEGGGSAPVPEPATLLALGVGTAVLVRSRAKPKR